MLLIIPSAVVSSHVLAVLSSVLR